MKNCILKTSFILGGVCLSVFTSINAYSQGMGIGIASPVSVLHVYENTTSTGTSAGLTIENDGTGDAVLQFLLTGGQRWAMGIDNSSADEFKISSASDVAGSTRFTIQTDGDFGVNTSAPAATFEIFPSAIAQQGLMVSGLAGQTGNLVELRDNGSNVQAYIDPNGAAVFNEESNDADFRVESNGNTNMLYVDAGNDMVGIGQAAPEEKLHVGDNTGGDDSYILVQADGNQKAGIKFISGLVNYWHLTHDDNNAVFQLGMDASEWLSITSDGRLYGSALHNNAGAVTGTTNQYIASGTYTPTLFNTTNISTSTAYVCQWIRVGNVVTVSGRVDIDATAGAPTATVMGMSLPIASALTGTQQAAGTASSPAGSTAAWAIFGDAANNRVSFNNTTSITTNTSVFFTFTYLVL